ncbi:MAG: exonuclease SbcCD subunit D [Chloroflexi bacterium]|nr:exonuclease SbcCD subunit D [Chloroflexota bacterium]
MRILHFADLHIGVENYGRVDPATGLSTRLGDFLRALDQVVDYALANEVDLVLFCGDAYKSRDPSQTHQREFARRIMRLTGGGVPAFLLVGNHDLPYAAGRATALDIYQTLGVPGVTVGRELGTQVVESRRGERLQIVAVPWLNRSWLLAQEEHKNLAARPLNELMEEKLQRVLQVEFSRLDPELPAVLAGHLAHAEAVPGSERRMTVGSDPAFLLSTLTDPGGPSTSPSTSSGHRSGRGMVDYVALGHIHKQQAHQSRGVPVVYAGSLQRVDFGEEEDQKGFYVVEIDPARPAGERLRSYDFVPVEARAFVTIRVRSHSGNPTEAALRAIARRERDIRDAIVQVQVELAAGQEGLLDDAAIRRALASAHYIAGISREAPDSPRRRLGEVKVEELAPLQALELYLRARETPSERTQALLEYGRRLIESPEAASEMAP